LRQNLTVSVREQLEEKYDMDAWQRMVYEEFKTTILAKGSGLKTFPCIYATMGYRAGDHRYVFLESDDPSEPRNVRIIAPALRAYLQVSRSLGPNTSLVIMGAPTEGNLKAVEEYNNEFFDMLRGLRIWDSKPWPKDIPQETMNEKWTFCFDGIPLFPVALTPAHQRRWSRHAPVPLVALQPKWVLDNLMSTPEKRKSATGKVRKLLAEYDQIEISPDLTQYGDKGTSEIHQLCLRDENETMDCPFDDFDKGGARSSSSPSSSRRSSMEERAA
jgi:FPC/CPF motif-containing protein YcgG